MKLKETILCVAALLTAFGTSLGLLEIGSYLRSAFQPLKVEIKPLEPITPPTYAPARMPDFKPSAAAPTVEDEPGDLVETGYYYIIGDNPKGFANFDYIMFSMYEYDEKHGTALADKPFGILLINGKESNHTVTWMKISGKRLSLKTETQKGIRYQFEGKFTKEEVKAKYPDGSGEYTDTALLKGRLTKWRNGVKIAEAEVRFGYTMGC